MQDEKVDEQGGDRLGEQQQAGERQGQARYAPGNQPPGAALHDGTVDDNPAPVLPGGGIEPFGVKQERGREQRHHAARADENHQRQDGDALAFVRFADAGHGTGEHRAGGDAEEKAPRRARVVAKLRPGDAADADNRQQQAGQLQRRLPFVKAQIADGGEKENLQAVEQRGDAGADGVNALVPEGQVKGEHRAGCQRKCDGAAVSWQGLSEAAAQQQENAGRYQQPPEGDGIGAYGDMRDDDAAQAKKYAAENQTRSGGAFGIHAGRARALEGKAEPGEQEDAQRNAIEDVGHHAGAFQQTHEKADAQIGANAGNQRAEQQFAPGDGFGADNQVARNQRGRGEDGGTGEQKGKTRRRGAVHA